jgi:hypothetical protein
MYSLHIRGFNKILIVTGLIIMSGYNGLTNVAPNSPISVFVDTDDDFASVYLSGAVDVTALDTITYS